MEINSQFAAEQADRESARAAAAAELAQFRAARARLLVGSYNVGIDQYSGGFVRDDVRPPAELSYRGRAYDYDDARSLHRLPNGDWLEVISGGKSWTRHTYDPAYALDRAKRRAIGGYTLRPDLVALIRELKAVGANRMHLYALWQQDFSADAKSYQMAYSAEGNLTASEQQAEWIQCLANDGIPRHPKHRALIEKTIELLREPDVLREYPAPLDAELCNITHDLERQLSVTNQ
jgi:hypothetical protein